MYESSNSVSRVQSRGIDENEEDILKMKLAPEFCYTARG